MKTRFERVAALAAATLAPLFFAVAHGAHHEGEKAEKAHGDREAEPAAEEAEAPALAPYEKRLENGKKIFMAQCSVCHGEKGNGKGPAAAALNPKPRNFRRGLKNFQYGASFEEVVATISNGPPTGIMPAFKGALEEEEIQAVATYVRSLAGAKEEDGDS